MIKDTWNHFKIETYLDSVKHYRWRLKYLDGSVLAESGRSYENKADALQAIGLIKKQFPDAMIIDSN